MLIIYEDIHFLVVDKPAGLLVHKTPNSTEETLVDRILKHCPSVKGVGDNPEFRPGIVHRLDRDVSGLLIVAKNQRAFEHLKKQFQERKVQKEYITLVFGRVPADEGVIKFPVARSKKKARMVAKPKGEGEKEAETYFEVVKRYQHYTLLRVIPKTGRTHQIRVHLAARGHPIVGDDMYKPKKLHSRIKLGRVFLHAAKLGFYDLDEKWVKFESELPRELNQISNIKMQI